MNFHYLRRKRVVDTEQCMAQFKKLEKKFPVWKQRKKKRWQWILCNYTKWIENKKNSRSKWLLEMNNPTFKKGKKTRTKKRKLRRNRKNKQKQKKRIAEIRRESGREGKRKKTVLILRCPEFSGAHYNVAHCSVQKIARKIEILFLVSHNTPRSGMRSSEPRIIIDTRGEIN